MVVQVEVGCGQNDVWRPRYGDEIEWKKKNKRKK